MRKEYVTITVICVLLIALVGWWLSTNFYQDISVKKSPVNKRSSDVESPKVALPLYFPMTRYKERTTVRPFGTSVGPDDHHSLPCGDQFEGFHTADDLEVTSAELDSEVPVFAIADGKVTMIGSVGGYGGLIVVEHKLNGKTVSAYYGHVDVSNLKINEGNMVKAGAKIANLGDHCSVETSLERKHLHFGIHKDPEIDVRGYVPTLKDLSNWYDPKKLFLSNSAKEPIE